MGRVTRHLPVKLIAGFIFRQEDALEKAREILQKKFGKIDFQSQTFDFSYTRYYEKEFGAGLKRVFVSFAQPILPQSLARIKLFTNKLEQRLSKNGCRRINIDPGYIDQAKLVLASTKDFSHRIYLDKGIFAELTLLYRNKTFTPLDWTYPDYRTQDYIRVFNRIREIYGGQIKDNIF